MQAGCPLGALDLTAGDGGSGGELSALSGVGAWHVRRRPSRGGRVAGGEQGAVEEMSGRHRPC
eukprot:364326-Chlamydomonas_euryale.AAC.2